jgi:hypothetical protein
MAGVAKQIIGSFEDIGKDIAQEVSKVPTDIAGKALESLGATSQKGQKGNQQVTGKADTANKPEGALGQLDQTKDQQVKRSIAREALVQLSGKPQQKEPTVQERLEKEKQEKNEKTTKQAAVAQKMAPLPAMSQKTKPGNLYGIKQKSSSEMSKNVRQD